MEVEEEDGIEMEQTCPKIKSPWDNFSKEKLNRDSKLRYAEPIIKDGIRIAQVDVDEVQEQAAQWNSAVICMVLGANPPIAVFEGFIKRIWSHLGIMQVARMTMGLVMVKFHDEASRDQVLEEGLIHFDRKPVIVRPWTNDLNAVKLVRSVPLWIRLHNLGLQYWGNKSLSALVSTVGKPIMVDQHTKDRTRIQFARVLVEMEITDEPPSAISYLNEFGQLSEQKIDYEWMPAKCKKCAGFGHIQADCRREEFNKKTGGDVLKQGKNELPVKSMKNKAMKENTNGEEGNKLQQGEWSVPKKIIGSRGVQSRDSIMINPIGESNAFIALQEQNVEQGKEGNSEIEGDQEGRLLVMWRKSFVRVIVIAESSQLVHCYVKMTGVVADFCVTFVYGFNSIETRKSLWEEMRNLKFPVKPWLVVGDFNAVFELDDRIGGNSITLNDIVDSNNWLMYANVEVMSDHCSCVISIVVSERIGIKPFKFFNFWTEHPDFKKVVLESWYMPLRSMGLKALYFKLMRVKHRLKDFNRNTIGDIGRNYQEAKEGYLTARRDAQSNPMDIVIQRQEKEAAASFSLQEKMYHNFLRQRSKINWLCKGDENNSYFHSVLKQRRMENRITSYTNEQRLVVDNFPEVVTHFLSHFKNIMGRRIQSTSQIDPSCIDHGAKLSLDDQAPGPDGFGSGFFKALWAYLGNDISDAIKDFFRTGRMPPDLHATMITLIPKIENPSKAVDYRPIACCTTLYKCISKLLCSRLAQVLPNLVNQNQGAFVQGRSIAHNVMMVQDLLKNYKRKGVSPRCAIKVDISKAYDTVCWDFLEDLLNAYHLPSRYHPMCKELRIVSLCFADDLMLFSKDSDIKQSIMRDFGLMEGSYPLQYLGVPLRPTKWKAEDCGIIIKKMRQRLHTWASRHLSYAGRVQLIHSVLLGLRNYWMSIFVLPHSVTKEVEKICRGFLWGWNGNRSKIHLASWEKVCLPKSYDGLGFKDGIRWNHAILAKYVWAINSKRDLLWVKWVNSIYLKNKSFWEYELKQDSSWYWRKLCHVRDKFSREDVQAAGRGKKFKTNWLYNSKLVHHSFPYNTAVWSSLNLPKHRFILWQVVNNNLLTRDKLAQFRIVPDSLDCPVCELEAESHDHLFFECVLSSRVMQGVFDWLGFQAWPAAAAGWRSWLQRNSIVRKAPLSRL
uniref:Reverse transcriptase domain-containing protein n=1 Tax=Cannabis sativa TaxID=3483 RepID=A0A803Q184_CANSA